MQLATSTYPAIALLMCLVACAQGLGLRGSGRRTDVFEESCFEHDLVSADFFDEPGGEASEVKGIMFDVECNVDDETSIVITAMTIEIEKDRDLKVQVYTKDGSHISYERDGGPWLDLGIYELEGKGQGKETMLKLDSTISLPPKGRKQAFYVVQHSEDDIQTIRFDEDDVGYEQKSNKDMIIYVGTGKKISDDEEETFDAGYEKEGLGFSGRLYYRACGMDGESLERDRTVVPEADETSGASPTTVLTEQVITVTATASESMPEQTTSKAIEVIGSVTEQDASTKTPVSEEGMISTEANLITPNNGKDTSTTKSVLEGDATKGATTTLVPNGLDASTDAPSTTMIPNGLYASTATPVSEGEVSTKASTTPTMNEQKTSMTTSVSEKTTNASISTPPNGEEASMTSPTPEVDVSTKVSATTTPDEQDASTATQASEGDLLTKSSTTEPTDEFDDMTTKLVEEGDVSTEESITAPPRAKDTSPTTPASGGDVTTEDSMTASTNAQDANTTTTTSEGAVSMEDNMAEQTNEQDTNTSTPVAEGRVSTSEESSTKTTKDAITTTWTTVSVETNMTTPANGPANTTTIASEEEISTKDIMTSPTNDQNRTIVTPVVTGSTFSESSMPTPTNEQNTTTELVPSVTTESENSQANT